MSLKCIDVSNWQDGINLEAVPADFVIMKATQGDNYTNPDLNRQYEQDKNVQVSQKQHYTFVKNDTLHVITKRNKTNDKQLVAWNNLKDPNKIYPGQTLRVK